MGQKIHPIGFGLSVQKNWSSRWYANSKNFREMLESDIKVREFLNKNRTIWQTDRRTEKLAWTILVTCIVLKIFCIFLVPAVFYHLFANTFPYSWQNQRFA